ncbi:Por secretion system C-terminal sorting domain-containing protein [Psychroflexus salarius]|uniref:Por secretion system C-terminal sorting domain-containing protein n=1 Tax=Psychroflexus salarius TaxID=1155689 RepID=A0A1M4SHT5_9FLAO|nr:T9SS type A sorting domain-containing protein [Psychroflexus salarius]SHE31803.1 Por secretion system C-terminal sorting domain-containing protein [Psychroflexus salarius]
MFSFYIHQPLTTFKGRLRLALLISFGFTAGFAFQTQTSGLITTSFTTSTVNGEDNVGGLVGLNLEGQISTSYARSIVNRETDGTETIGGFIGSNGDANTNHSGGEISYCYSTSSVVYLETDNPTTKGFIGEQTGMPTHTGNFFDRESSNQLTDYYTVADPVTTSTLNDVSTFLSAGWHFKVSDNEWGINSSTNDGYPFLRWEGHSSENIWLGINSSALNLATNWSEALVPTSITTVRIPSKIASNNTTLEVNSNLEITSLFIENEEANLVVLPTMSLKINGNITNNGQITFKSDATGEAYLDVFTGTISGTGTVITEKYYPLKRAFRLVSSPVDGGSLFDNWQNSGANDAGLGTHITGEVGTVGEYNATTGIDYTASGNPSLFRFSTANGWEAITDTKNTNLEAGVPYRLMVRGDRGIDLRSNASEGSTTLISTGALAVGSTDLTFPSATSGGTTYAFVANPYQSRIDVSELLSINTNANNNQLWVWDPMVNTRGAFVTVSDLTTGNGTATPNTSAATKFIEPGQSFFIQSTVTNPSLSFTESIKDVTTDLSVSSESIANTSELVLNLQDDNQAVIDGVRLRFSPSGNPGIDGLDITKLGNIDENLALVNNGTLFTIEHRSYPEAGEEAPLFTSNWRNENYSFVANLSNLEDTQVYLLDQYLETETLLVDGQVYSFSVDANIEASVSSSRFKLVFRNEALSFDETAAVSYRLFPNPATTQVHINTIAVNGEWLKLKLYNSLGQEVYQADKLVSDSSVVLEVNQLKTGVYHLEIEDKTGHKVVEKLIKH